MSIQIDSAQFEILVKKYLDDRQYVETLEELNNVDSNIYPPGIITYCKETTSIYKRNKDDTWTKIDMDDVNPYLFIYTEENYPDTTKTIYAHMEGKTFEEVKNKWVFIEDFLNMTTNNIIDINQEDINENNMYSQNVIDSMIELNYENSIEYVKDKLVDIIKPGFEKVNDISEMTDSGTFYLLESVSTPGQFVMYVIDDQGKTQPMGSSNMDLNNYQTLEDETLQTTSKKIVEAINGINLLTKENQKNLGDLDDIKIEEHSDTIIDALNYNQLVINRIEDVSDLNTENKETIVDSINEIDKKHGIIKKLNTTYKNNFVVALNSFFSSNVPAGAIFPYVGETPPPGYLLCDGAEYSISKYPDLFSAIGYNFGMGEESNFKVPSLMDARTPIGYNQDDEDFMNIGQIGGEENHSLIADEVPSHLHSINSTSHSHTAYTSSTYVNGYAYYRAGNTRLGRSDGSTYCEAGSNNSTRNYHNHYYNSGSNSHGHIPETVGNGAAHNNMQPYLMLNFIIKY